MRPRRARQRSTRVPFERISATTLRRWKALPRGWRAPGWWMRPTLTFLLLILRLRPRKAPNRRQRLPRRAMRL